MMAEHLRSRNPSSAGKSTEDDKEFHAKLRRNNDSEEKAKLKLSIRPLRHKNGLHIYLTRQDDPAFYYSVDITEDDYRELRIRQGLLVDMASFPAMVLRLLDNCISEETTDNPKFFPSLEIPEKNDEVTFEIQEINLYRRLAHLSLRLKKGNDAKVREHLSECLKNLRLEHSTTVKELETTALSLRNALDEKSSILSDLEAQRKEFSERDSSHKNRLAQEINEERERAAKHIAEMRLGYEAERRRLVEEHAATLRTLENRVAALDYDNRDLAEKKHKNEAMIQRLKDEQRNMSEECKRLRCQAEQHRIEKENLGQGNHELDRNVNRLQAKIDVLEQENSRLKEDVKRRDEMIEEMNNMRKHIEEELDEKKQKVTKRETAVKNVSQELVKANEIIRKLQDQNRKESQKVKLSCQILQEQEKVIQEKDSELEAARNDLKDKTEKLSGKSTDVTDLQRSIEELRQTNEDLSKKLKTNETVIQWLNKQLTTAQARDPGLRLGPPPEGIHFSPSAIASTSTPMNVRPFKENKKPNSGLDPKLLEPSPKLANSSRQPTLASRNAGASRTAGGGLLRRNLSANNVASSQSPVIGGHSPTPQSVYFAKT